MNKKGVILAAALILAPVILATSLMGFVILSVSGAAARNAGCNAPGTGASPASSTKLVAKTTAGTTVTLGPKQLEDAQAIVSVGRSLRVSSTGLDVALMTALQESRLWVYSNITAYPASADIAHDKDGGDHDSLGVFQQRPSAGWGTPAQVMDVTYAAEAFFGGSSGPNHGSPRGLLDIPGWDKLEPGTAAQDVQVSATPTAYAKWLPVAKSILAQVDPNAADSPGCPGSTGLASLPLKPGFNINDGFGHRLQPIAGASTWHPGDDLQHSANPCGDPVFAILPGTVTLSSELYLSIRNSEGFVVDYLHMFKSQRLVNVGDQVTTGEQIGVTGNVQPSTGCHLDLRINVSNNTDPRIAALPQNSHMPGYVDPEQFLALYGVTLCPPASCKRF